MPTSIYQIIPPSEAQNPLFVAFSPLPELTSSLLAPTISTIAAPVAYPSQQLLPQTIRPTPLAIQSTIVVLTVLLQVAPITQPALTVAQFHQVLICRFCRAHVQFTRRARRILTQQIDSVVCTLSIFIAVFRHDHSEFDFIVMGAM